MVWQWAYNIMLHTPAFCKTIQFHPCCRCHAAHTDLESNESAVSSLQSQPCWLIQILQSGSRTWCHDDFWMPPVTHLKTQRPRGQGRARQRSTQLSLWRGHLTYWLGPGMWGTTGTKLFPSVGTSRSTTTLPLNSHPPSWQGFQLSIWALEKSFPDWQKCYASPEATWSSLLVWAMDAFSSAHKKLPEPRWSCSYWWTSLKPLCCGSGCGCNCGCGLLLSQREHHSSQMLQMARAENYLMTLSLLISCLN